MSEKELLFPLGITNTGPGKWSIIHSKAFLATKDKLKNEFVSFMENDIQPYLGCKECQEHCLEYFKSNPIINYFNIKNDDIDIGIFLWAWEFHNVVNKRLGKKIITFDVAYNYYNNYKKLICSKGCDKTVDINKVINDIKGKKEKKEKPTVRKTRFNINKIDD